MQYRVLCFTQIFLKILSIFSKNIINLFLNNQQILQNIYFNFQHDFLNSSKISRIFRQFIKFLEMCIERIRLVFI